MEFRSTDDLSLAQGLSRQRPATATLMPELQIPLDLDPNAKPGGVDPFQEIYKREERARQTEYVRQQNAQQAAREAEIFKRESIQRQQILNGVTGTDPVEPRVTSRRPAWEQEFAPPREPRPSRATPPATPRTSGLAAEVDLLDRPPPAAPRSPLPLNPTIEARPNNLPVAGGTAAVEALARNTVTSSAVGGALDFGFRVVQGQPIQQAAVGAVGSTVGSAAGIILGAAVGGPVGGFIGGAIGGFIGGRIADLIFSQSRPRSVDNPQQVQVKEGVDPLGLKPGHYYAIVVEVGGSGRSVTRQVGVSIAPITNFRYEMPPGDNSGYVRWSSWDKANNSYQFFGYGSDGFGGRIVNKSFHETGNDPITNVPNVPPPSDNRPVQFAHPLNTEASIPSAIPRARENIHVNRNGEVTKVSSLDNYAPPSSKPLEGGNQRGDSPNWIPHGGLKGSPHPVHMPAPLVAPLPEFADPEQQFDLIPDLLSLPKNTPSIIVNEDGTVELIDYKPLSTNDLQPISLDQSFPSMVTLTSPASDPGRSTTSPFSVNGSFSARPNESLSQSPTASLPATIQSSAQPDATRPVPASTAPPVAGQPQPSTQNSPELISKLDDFGLILVGLKQVVEGIQKRTENIENRTSPDAIRNAANAATCEAFAPNGCNADIRDNARNAANNSANNRSNIERILNNTSDLANLTLLPTINNKLGPQMPGGLSSGLGRLSKFLGIDRLFNLLNFLVLLHNASMLSASLKITLLETLSSLGNATGLLQTSEGENVDLNTVFNQGVEKFIVSLIGEEAWASLKLTWRKYSPIYRAMNNGLSHIGNMFSSIGNGIETIGENTGKIGNAIRSAGVVRDNAYNYMSEKMNVHTNKFMTFTHKVGGVTQALDVINEVAESTIEGQESYAEAVRATKEFTEGLENAEKNPGIDNKAIKAEAEKIKENLIKDPTGEDEEGLLSFLTDL